MLTGHELVADLGFNQAATMLDAIQATTRSGELKYIDQSPSDIGDSAWTTPASVRYSTNAKPQSKASYFELVEPGQWRFFLAS